MKDAELIEKARFLLEHCKLAGASIDLCADLVENGFADTGYDDPEAIAYMDWQCEKLRELMLLHGVL